MNDKEFMRYIFGDIPETDPISPIVSNPYKVEACRSKPLNKDSQYIIMQTKRYKIHDIKDSIKYMKKEAKLMKKRELL